MLFKALISGLWSDKVPAPKRSIVGRMGKMRGDVMQQPRKSSYLAIHHFVVLTKRSAGPEVEWRAARREYYVG